MPTDPRPRTLRVYIADDSQAIRRRVAELLRDRGIEVVGEAGTPRDCIAGILAGRPDAVVLDVQLDGGSGLRVMKAVHAARPEIVFIVFTNNAMPAYRKRYLDEGAANFLDKSADFAQLADALGAACGRGAA